MWSQFYHRNWYTLGGTSQPTQDVISIKLRRWAPGVQVNQRLIEQDIREAQTSATMPLINDPALGKFEEVMD